MGLAVQMAIMAIGTTFEKCIFLIGKNVIVERYFLFTGLLSICSGWRRTRA